MFKTYFSMNNRQYEQIKKYLVTYMDKLFYTKNSLWGVKITE